MTVIDLCARREAKMTEEDARMAQFVDFYGILEPALLGLRDSGFDGAAIASELRFWAKNFERGDF
jgi:hypothetical protein